MYNLDMDKTTFTTTSAAAAGLWLALSFGLAIQAEDAKPTSVPFTDKDRIALLNKKIESLEAKLAFREADDKQCNQLLQAAVNNGVGPQVNAANTKDQELNKLLIEMQKKCASGELNEDYTCKPKVETAPTPTSTSLAPPKKD